MQTSSNDNTYWWLASAVVTVFFAWTQWQTYLLNSQHTDESRKSIDGSSMQRMLKNEAQIALGTIKFPNVPVSTSQNLADQNTTETKASNVLKVPTPSNTSSHLKAAEAVTGPQVQDIKIEHISDAEAIQQLSALQGIGKGGFQINFPAEQNERLSVQSFLYHCVGIGFGDLNAKNDLQIVKPIAQPVSSIVRVVSGKLLPIELDYKRAYAMQNPVRLYPVWLDIRLGKYLASASPKQPIVSFSANYKVQNNLLLLDNVVINGNPSAYVWTLVDGFNQNCKSKG